jgi:hypothetical protein
MKSARRAEQVAVIDHAVHIAVKSALLVEVKCVFHVILLDVAAGPAHGDALGRDTCRRQMRFFDYTRKPTPPPPKNRKKTVNCKALPEPEYFTGI